MKKGPVVIQWAEPRDWNEALMRLGKENSTPKSWTRFVPLIFGATAISAVLIWEWMNSDREGILSTIAAVITAAFIFGGIYLFQRLKMKYLPSRVWIRGNGIEMGDLLGSREWTAFSEMVGFYFDSDTVDGKEYRSLNWLPAGAQYPDSAVVPPEVDEDRIRTFFTSQGLEELESADA